MEKLQGLLDEVQSALDVRLREIAAQERQQAARLRKEAEARFEQARQALEWRRQQQLREAVERCLRHADESEKARLWVAERACFDALMAAVRKALASKQPSQAWFDARLAAVGKRFTPDSKLEISLNAAWRSRIRIPSGISVHTAPLIGGFRLADARRGVEIDASWNRRLEDIRRALWQHWHERIQNHQD